MKKVFVLFLMCIFSTGAFAQPYYGVQTHFGQIYRSDIDSAVVRAMLDSIKSAGIACIRDEMYWSLIETSPGQFSFPPQFDYYAEQARLRGISILLILNYNNPLYAAHAGAGIATDTNRALYLRYCKEVIQRYVPKGITLYEIWNEPNLQMFWDPAPNAADYAKVLQKIYHPLKNIDSTITIIAGATSPSEGAALPNIPWTQFLSAFIQAGGGNYCDAVSFHLYRVDRGPEAFLEADYTTLQNIIGFNKYIYLTECGYPTNLGYPNVSFQKQADYVSRLYLLGRKLSKLKQISYYDFRNDGNDPSSTEANFGLVFQALNPKPSYTYVKTQLAELESKIYRSSSIQGGFYKMTFSDLSERTHALWTNLSNAEKPEQFATKYVRVVNSDGQKHYRCDNDKIIEVLYTASPVYITELSSPPALDSVSIYRPADTLIVSSGMQLSLRGAVHTGGTMFIDSAEAVWTALDTTASFSTPGYLYAVTPGTCRVRAEFGGKTAIAAFVILPAYNYLEIDAFNSFDSTKISFSNLLPETALTIIDTNFTTPPKSLRVDYAFKFSSISAHRLYYAKTYQLIGEPDTLLLDVYNDGWGHILNFTFSGADGQEFTINTSSNALTNVRGWKTVKVPLTNFGAAFRYPAKLKRLLVYFVRSGGVVDSTYRGSILVDNLRIHNGIISGAARERTEDIMSWEMMSIYPNPFNPVTTITYVQPRDGAVILQVYDLLGNEVAVLVNEEKRAGEYRLSWNAGGLPSGMYFCRLQAGEYTQVKKLILMK